MSDAAFGVEFLAVGAGKCSECLPEAYRGCAYYTDPDRGSVTAHELGYLLPGSHAHAVSGIMRSHLEVDDLRRIVKGSLLYTPQQAKIMRRKAWLLEATEQSMASAFELAERQQ